MRWAAALVLGVATALALVAAGTLSVRLRPGDAGWRRLVGGVGPDGLVSGPAVAVLHGLDRREHRLLRIEAAAPPGPSPAVAIALDGGPLQSLPLPAPAAAVLPLAPAPAPGLRIDLRPSAGSSAVRLRLLEVEGARPRWGTALLAGLVAAALTVILAATHGLVVATALGLVWAALLALASLPALVVLTLPAAGSLVRVALPAVFLIAAAVVVSRAAPAERRVIGRGAWLLAALVFGAWVRAVFLPSTGSWDTEYWKAWMLRAASHGVTRAYGDPGSVPAGHLLAQARGREELWRIDWGGRLFVIDYPPLAIALWRWSWRVVTALGRGLDGAEAQSIAVKMPPVAGDVAAVALLLYALRRTPASALDLAALYWALPVSWLSSAVLGYFDATVAPLAVAALLAAGRGRSSGAGCWLALAALVKPTALVVAPAVVVALVAARAPLGRAVLAGAAVLAAVLLPYAWAGTLSAAVVHVYRILFQQRLSGGFPNVWWIAGHLLMVSRGLASPAGPVPFARIELLPFPAGAIGTALFAAAAVWIVARQRRSPGPRPAALAGATLVFAYAMLAVGVHENHPHPMFLMLAATGLTSRRLRLIAAGTAGVYVLDMLALSGLGRFHGPRFSLIQPFAARIEGWRMAAGFDLTLALAPVAIALFAVLMVSLRRELERMDQDRPS